MLASQAALCLLTGSLEMLVFQTLSAGNIGQFGAPGTEVASTGVLLAAAAPHPATDTAANMAAATLRALGWLTKCPVSMCTVASWHGSSGRAGRCAALRALLLRGRAAAGYSRRSTPPWALSPTVV